MALTQERLKQLLSYNPETGQFIRLTKSAIGVKIGDVAGTKRRHDCYIFISLDSKLYKAHRLAWLYVYGKWPDMELDHIDGNKKNNSILNLRDVDRKTNSTNERVARKSNLSSGLLGVTWDKVNKKWVSQIMVNGKNKKIGRFATKEQAHLAYLEEKRKLHIGCTI